MGKKTVRFLTVGWKPPSGGTELLGSHLTVDIGDDREAPSFEEMERLAFAVKMEFGKILRERADGKKRRSK